MANTDRLSDDEIDYCMNEACGSLALALHDRTGWPIRALYSSGELLHVYLMTPDGLAADAKGIRQVSGVKADFNFLDIVVEDQIKVLTRADLAALMSDSDDQPLYSYDRNVGIIAERWLRGAKK